MKRMNKDRKPNGSQISNREDNVGHNKTNNQSIRKSLTENKAILEERFNYSYDMKFYNFLSGTGVEIMFAYLEDMTNKEELDQDIVLPIKAYDLDAKSVKGRPIEQLRNILPLSNVSEISSMEDVINGILNGQTAIFYTDVPVAFMIQKPNYKLRAIEQPNAESVIRGPKEGFIESIHVNRSLIRRRIKSVNLIFEQFIIGSETKTEVNIVYIKGVVSQTVVDEVRKKLQGISINAIMDTGNIEELIQENPRSPISTVGDTEKPDMLAAKILEGRVGIMCDGSPHVLTVPHVFAEAIHSIEDYYSRPFVATFLRIIRFNAFVLSMALPALYVSLTTFHQEMIPTILLRTMAGASEGIPLPSAAEAILMTLFFEFLKESGTRLPKTVGSAISIVGALILGDAAVKAGIISAPMILVTAFTAVSSFIVPSLNESLTLFRIVLLILSGMMGLYGFTVGVFIIIIHAVSLESFGTPYLAPVAPMSLQGLKDFTVRFPIKELYQNHYFKQKE